jgi:hypothetical protein
MDLARVHEALLQAHQELIEDPRHGVEGLDAASCPPHIRHLAQLAIRATWEGFTAERWRSWIVGGIGPEAAPLPETAESCMRSLALFSHGPD